VGVAASAHHLDGFGGGRYTLICKFDSLLPVLPVVSED
jgi:hypothetical protein